MQEIWYVLNRQISVKEIERNDSANTITWIIVKGGGAPIDEIKWEVEYENMGFKLNIIKVSEKNFSDEKIVKKYFALFWLDEIEDGKIGEGDFLKLKVPYDGNFTIMAFWKTTQYF